MVGKLLKDPRVANATEEAAKASAAGAAEDASVLGGLHEAVEEIVLSLASVDALDAVLADCVDDASVGRSR